jgi:hypothetical protein
MSVERTGVKREPKREEKRRKEQKEKQLSLSSLSLSLSQEPKVQGVRKEEKTQLGSSDQLSFSFFQLTSFSLSLFLSPSFERLAEKGFLSGASLFVRSRSLDRSLAVDRAQARKRSLCASGRGFVMRQHQPSKSTNDGDERRFWHLDLYASFSASSPSSFPRFPTRVPRRGVGPGHRGMEREIGKEEKKEGLMERAARRRR